MPSGPQQRALKAVTVFHRHLHRLHPPTATPTASTSRQLQRHLHGHQHRLPPHQHR